MKKLIYLITVLILIIGIIVVVFNSRETETQEPPIVDETANWKTYQNQEYEFEVKYPENWNYVANQKQIDDMLLADIDFNKGQADSISVMVENRPFEEARSLMSYQPLIDPVKESKITIGGIQGLKQEGVLKTGIPETRILINKNNKVYTLLFYKINSQLASKIFSTFKFLD